MINAIAFIGSNNNQSTTASMLKNALKKASKFSINLNYEVLSSKDVNILQCTGCRWCFLHGQCPLDLKDDMSIIKKKLQQADIIIFASPVYANNVSGSMKNVIDRLSYWTHTFELSNKKAIAVTTSSFSGYIEVLSYLDSFLSAMGCFTFPAKFFLRGNNPELFEDSVARDFLKMARYNGRLTNDNLEKLFLARKSHFEYLISHGVSTYETNYWYNQGYLNCLTYLEFMEKRGGNN